MKKQVVIKLIIHVHFKWLEKYYCFSDWISHVARQKINAEAIHEFFKQNHQPFFKYFNFTSDIHNKNHHLSKLTLDYHNSITQNQKYSKIREEYHMENPLSHTMIINFPQNPYPHSTKTTRDPEDDALMETI